ncbi:protein M7-like [Tripterygium wilfordii]|uniref:protein M7-like n=1 Tax=Tripterygium wilfordii TaxID=458696 RepID=UPI0018F7FDA8|nr:protein M7-like [Tripterygium wilfordii]
MQKKTLARQLCYCAKDTISSQTSSTQKQKMKLVHSKALPLLVFLLVMTCYVERGRGTACTSTFFSALVQLIPCRAAVAPFSPIPPSETCCNAVKTLGQPCLCVLVNGPPITGVDRNMALQLPDKCTANFEPCEIMK